MEDERLYGKCGSCGNVSGYDEESLKGSTWNINGLDLILCCPCEDDLLVQIADGRGIKITMGEGGDVDKVEFCGKTITP